MDYERTVRAARWIARNLPVQCQIDWQDLAQESALEQLRGRKSVTGPMLDALRRAPLIGRSRPSERKDLRQAEMPELSVPPHNSDHMDAELACWHWLRSVPASVADALLGRDE